MNENRLMEATDAKMPQQKMVPSHTPAANRRREQECQTAAANRRREKECNPEEFSFSTWTAQRKHG